jgi:hypothetical protein
MCIGRRKGVNVERNGAKRKGEIKYYERKRRE